MKMRLSMAGKTIGLYAVLVLLSTMFVMMVSTMWLRIILNLALLVAFGAMCLNDGGYNGEKGCSVNEMIERRRAEGKEQDSEMAERAYNPANGFVAALLALLPLVLIAAVNLVIQSMPDVNEVVKTTATVTARVVFMPFVSLYELVPENVLYILFLPLGLFLPTCLAIGYLLGPKLHAKKIKDMQAGTRRKRRNLKVNKKPRQPKQPKHEV